MSEFFDAGVAPARGQILARSRAVARWAKAAWLICLQASLLLSAYAQTTTRGFGSGTNQFTMDFVTIGNPNNPADTTGQPNPAGSVAYTYNLGKHEVSRDMIDKANATGGLGLTLGTITGATTNMPATGIDWYEAARFVNWLNISHGYPAAYKFSGTNFSVWTNGDAGFQAGNPYRNNQARYWLPSVHEWYKGAYGSPSGTWYDYPTGSDSAPTSASSGTNANSAIYNLASGVPAAITNAGGLSAYGIMGQGGNAWEWVETAADGTNDNPAENREYRGGVWTTTTVTNLSASIRTNGIPETGQGMGFRVASADLANLDTDGDGLKDLVESNTGTYVSAFDTGTSPTNTDSDGDGLSDGLEISTFGTDPSSSQVPGALVTQQSGANGFVATWGVVFGAAGYEVQASTEPTFTTGLVGGDRPVSGGMVTNLAITGIANQIRYYRVRSVFASTNGPVTGEWSPAVSAPNITGFGKYVSLNASGNLDNFQPAVTNSPTSNSYTITFWMRPDRIGGPSGTENVQVVRQGINSVSGTANVDLDLLPDGSLCFGQKDSAGNSKWIQTQAKTVLASNWHHVALVRDATNSTLRIYLNGQGVGTNPTAFGLTNWTITNSMGFAASQDALNDDSNTNRFKGAMDDVRVYRTVRTSAQILQDMGAPLTTVEANNAGNASLVFYAPLEGTSLSSTNANSFYKGTLNGNGSGTITSQAVLMTPTLTWTPSPINLVAPAVLSAIELTATATAPTGGPVSGSWSYLPAAGTSLSNGTNEVVGTFVPTDLVRYAIGTITNQIVVTEPSYSVPGVETGPTNSISGLTQTSVKLVGGITNLGGTTVTNAGFYLNTNSTATNGVKYSAPGTSFNLGSFSNTITGLTPGTSYTYRAFAANSVGTGYGADEYSFTTPSPFTYTNNGTNRTITGYTGTGGVVEIPATIGGGAVTAIGNNAFQGKTSLTTVVIPNGVTTIGNQAFQNCSSLTSITIPDSVTTIGSYSFAGCISMTSITLPTSLSSIGRSAFESCGALASISIPNLVTAIEADTFSQCVNLASVRLPSNLTRIESGAFAFCYYNLTTITIPRTVTNIVGGAFYDCLVLAEVKFEGPYPDITPIADPIAFRLNDRSREVPRNAKGYYLASESGTWTGKTILGLTLVPPDTQPPVITLIGANPVQIYKGATFSDPGATVTDNRDVTRSITGSGTVDTATVGNYTRTYNATDAAGNPAVQVTRTVNVVLDPTGDEDGDGVTNGAESSAGTNPLVKNILRFQTIDMLALGKGNFSIAESNGGSGAPVGFRYGTPAYYGGVPFFITDQSNQVWAPGVNGTGVVSETFPIAVNNVYGFYTLAGLWWGVAGSYVTYTFNFSDGSSYSKELTNNVDLRDYNIPSSFANSINGTTTQNVFSSGNYHLDRQWIDFAAAGHGGKNLVSFTVTDRGASDSSRIFLAAATAQVGAPGQIPPGATDTDGDGILDSYELGLPLSTNPLLADTDGDGLSDGTEISGTTDPLVADVDNDGLKDGVEFAIGTNPLVADSDSDGTPDGDEDADNDGGSNRIEVGLGNSLTVANVYNRLINGSFEDGTVKPSSNNWRAVPQNDVPGWRTTENNSYTIELWYSGFLGSSGNDGNTLAELNYNANGTLYQDVTMTVNSPVSYSFLHRARDVSVDINEIDVMDFKIDELYGGPGTSVVNNKFTRRVETGTSWVRYSGSQATTVEAGKTYRFSYTSISPTGGSGNLLDDASFGIDQDGDDLLDYEELALGTNPLDFDSDNDGLEDGEEVITYGTNPVRADTDGDGARDGVEVTAGTNPNEESSLPKPVISIQPVSITNTVGGGVTFSVTATNPGGSPSALTYQWYKNGEAILTGTNPNLIILPLTIAEAGNYTVVVSNSYGAVTSSIASLTVNKANPTITEAPTATSITYGQTLAFSTLSGGEARIGVTRGSVGTLIPGTFAFSNTTSVPAAGTSSQNVIFTPTDIDNYNTVPTSVSVTVNQALISSGFSHTLYLGAGATTVTAWGVNSDGRLGVGDTASPVNWAKAVQGIPLGYTVTGLSAGGTHSLILAGGQVYAAGSDRYGQLGQGAVNGANKTSFTSVAIPSSTPVAVSAGGNHSLIVTASGKVFACGDNTYGQLAQPVATASSGALVEVNFPGLSTKIVSVAAGADHNLAVDENGGVWVWGRNSYGQLGKGTRTAAERIPSKLVGVAAQAVATGFSHSLILETSGKVRGFGRNNCGQTGQSATSSVVLVPTLIAGLNDIQLLAAGTDSSFAIDGVGQLRGWGYNAYGELLLGYASPSSSPSLYVPTPSPIATNVFNVAGGGYSTLAVGVQGVIFGGRNDVGQSGNGPDPELVVGDYYNDAGSLTLNNLTMDLAGTTETLYDQIFVGNGAVTLNGILNLMFVGTYTGPVYGSTQTFDLIWAQNGIVLGTGYQFAFNQAGYLVESAVVDKSVEGVSGKALQATVRAVVTAMDLAKAVDLARPSLDGVESVSYGGSTGLGIRTLSVSPGVEMIYSYERPTGGVSSGAQYFVNGITYRVEQVSSLTGAWGDASVSGTTVTPLGNGGERVTLRISSSGGAGFLRLQVENPQATGINAGVGSAVTY